MRKTLAVLTFLSLAALPAIAQAPGACGGVSQDAFAIGAASSAPPPVAIPTSDGGEPVPDATAGSSEIRIEGGIEPLPMSYYPPCVIFIGKPCSTQGSIAYCEWQECEPEISTCESDHVWHFGNLP